MIIGIAGPYSAPTAAQRQDNLDLMNQAAARLLEKGHIPLIGINAALPVVQLARIDDPYAAMMRISLALIDRCEGLLLLGASPGAKRECDLIMAKGLPVYYDVEEVPDGPTELQSIQSRPKK